MNASTDTTRGYVIKVSLTYTDGTTCKDSFSKVVVWDLPIAKINPISNGTQCMKSNMYCFSQSSSESKNHFPLVKYDWNFGDGTVDSGDASGKPAYNSAVGVQKNGCYQYQQQGKYDIKLIVTDAHGCTSQDILQGKVHVLLNVPGSFGVGNNGRTTFVPTMPDTSGFHIIKFRWDFGDSTAMDSTNWSTSHSYSKQGVYTAYLEVWTKEGCYSKAPGTVSYLFSAISPEIASSISFSVYPNPSSGNFTIDYSLNEKANIKMLLFDMPGRKISELLNQNKSAGSYTYYTNDLNILHGTYILKIYKDNIPAGEKLIVVQP